MTMKKFHTYEISDPRFEPENLRYITVKSEHLRGRGDCTVFVPEGDTSGGLPLVILLHGVYGSHWAWTRKIGVHTIAGELIRSGALAPMVIAMPSDGLWGDGSGYLAHNGKDFEKWITEDVPGLVRQGVPAVRSSSPVFIGGLSMGGFGALRLAAKYPELFQGASGHSSITCLEDFLPFLAETERAYYSSRFGKERLLDYMMEKRDKLPPFRFDCGRKDILIESNRALHEDLIRNGIPHQYDEFEGEHSNDYWHENIHRSLLFFHHLLQRKSP